MANYCEIYQKRRTFLLYTLINIVLIGLGYFYMINSTAMSSQCNPMRELCIDNPIVYYTIGKTLIVLFGIFAFLSTIMLIKPYKLFYINDHGFWAKDYGFVYWEDVTKLYIDNLIDHTVIFFGVRENTALKLPVVNRIIRHFKNGDLHIELASGYDEVNDVFKLMRPHCHYLALNYDKK
ncbi:hypothetical protein J6P92_02660 [bacterium]|nr:hypothetical protein [bacterium]